MLRESAGSRSTAGAGSPRASRGPLADPHRNSTSAAPTPSRRCRCSPTISHEKMTPNTGVKNIVTATRLDGWLDNTRHSNR